MTWWGVRLDGVALINLIMCIGFSVDFSAHICYHYLTEEGKQPSERIRASLYALGLPIIQVRATLKRSFYVSFCPPSAVRPSVRPQKTSPDFAPVRPPPWSQSYTDV